MSYLFPRPSGKTVARVAGLVISVGAMVDWQYTNNKVQSDPLPQGYTERHGNLASYQLRHKKFPVRSWVDEISSLAFPVSMFLTRKKRRE